MISRNSAVEKALLDGLKKSSECCNVKNMGDAITALAALYKSTKSEEVLTLLEDMIKKAIASNIIEDCAKNNDLDILKIGSGLYVAAAATGNSMYIDEAVKLAKQINTQPKSDKGYFIEQDTNLATSYKYQPFYMNYETKNGGKERYNDVIAQYKAIHAEYFDKTVGCSCDNKIKVARLSSYAAGLIDTMEVMDQMIYEIYHKMMEFYKQTVKLMIAIDEEMTSIEESNTAYLQGYSILKGCRMKVLHTEKYEKRAMKLWEEMEKKAEVGFVPEEICAAAMYYSEVIRNREYQDYGRGKGGALWS